MAKFVPPGASPAGPSTGGDYSYYVHPRIALLAARIDAHALSLNHIITALVELQGFAWVWGSAGNSKEMTQLRNSSERLMRTLHEDLRRRIGLMGDAATELREMAGGRTGV